MSNLEMQAESDCKTKQSCSQIELLLLPKEKVLGGFSVRRTLPSRQRKMVGPWIFFDHMGPARFEPGPGVNVRPHPHIGLATVTYLLEGEMLHRDSVGSVQVIKPGDINLMVSGRGIVHSERERPEMTEVARTIHGLQLWLVLPEKDQEIEPAFYHYDADDLPRVSIGGVPVRVMIGSAYEQTSPVKTFADTLYIEADLRAGQTLELPAAQERAVYVASGSLSLQDTRLETYSLAVLAQGENIVVTAEEDSRIAVIGGESMAPRFIDWNFVSTDKNRIAQARQDWREQRFALVPDDDEEFIPLP